MLQANLTETTSEYKWQRAAALGDVVALVRKNSLPGDIY